METPRQKVVRHIRAGDLGKETIRRGVDDLIEYWFRGPDGLSAGDTRVEQGYGGNPGVTYINAQLILPERDVFFKKNPNKTEQANSTGLHKSDAEILLFDPRLKLNLINHDDYPDDVKFGRGHDLQSMVDGTHGNFIASFRGPTSSYNSDMYPNNGYYYDGRTYTDFFDTNPPGGRRGAICLLDDGSVKLLSDTEKWGLVNAGFPKCRGLVGTSFYFTDGDVADTAIMKIPNGPKSHVSYLIQWPDVDGKSNLGYIRFAKLVTRRTASQMIHHLLKDKFAAFIATELELENSYAVVRNKGNLHYPKLLGKPIWLDDRISFGISYKEEDDKTV